MSELGVSHDVTIEIGGTPIALRSGDPAFRRLLESRYSEFLGSGEHAPFALDVEVLPVQAPIDDDINDENEDDDVHVTREGSSWRLFRGDFLVNWDPQRGHGTIRQELSPYAVDSALRVLHTLIQAPRGGFLLHGASAIRNGRAFLFSGVSGAGKTTISRLAPPDATLLTDEISYIRREGDGYHACGTPFAGELARVGTNCRAPIAHLFFLAQGPENRIDPIPTRDALRMLLRNILFFADDSNLVEMVFRSACEFLGHVPASRLTFFPDERVWELIK